MTRTTIIFGLAALLSACSGASDTAQPRNDSAAALDAMEAEGTISDAMVRPETIVSEGPVDSAPDPALEAIRKAREDARRAAMDRAEATEPTPMDRALDTPALPPVDDLPAPVLPEPAGE